MKYSGSNKRLFTRQFWKNIENKYYALFLIAVFLIFSSFGFVTDLLTNLTYSYTDLITTTLVSGILSTLYAYAATRNLPMFPIFLALQVAYTFLLRPEANVQYSQEELDTKFTVVAVGIMLSVTLGYAFFTVFISKVGVKHFLMKAEMDLAKGIHEVLVPEINHEFNNINVWGKSIPATEVGGDLVDAVEIDKTIYCTIADVSGHGVSSGVYTGMIKSSIRTMLSVNNKLNELITRINNSIFPLIKKNMFITVSVIKVDDTNNAEFIVAGHLPILYFNKKQNEVQELSTKQIPIGVKSDYNFVSSSIQYSAGDIFLLLTDGVTEASDKDNNQLGIERIKTMLQENSEKPAEQISKTIFDEVDKKGQQKDDVSLLIIKC